MKDPTKQQSRHSADEAGRPVYYPQTHCGTFRFVRSRWCGPGKRGWQANCLRAIISVIVGLSLSEATTAYGASLELGKWSHVAPVRMQGRPAKGVVEFALTPKIFDISGPGLEDLRVVGDAADEMSYVIKDNSGKSRTIPLAIELYNRTFVPGHSGSVTLDFGTKVKKNSIAVRTAGANFRRRVRVEASDDGETWEMIKDGGFIFRIPPDDGKASGYDRSVVPIPVNDQRYLRITVFTGGHDDREIAIEEVKAWMKVVVNPVTAAVPIVSTKTSQKNRVTEIIIDLGHRNMPLYDMAFRFSDENFFRKVTLFARNWETKVVRRPVEDSPAHEKTVKVAWKRIKRATIFRFSSSAGKEESLKVNLGPCHYRYLLVKVDNGDDPPLSFTGATVTRLVRHVEFQPRGSSQYEVYVGNPKASRPTYDLGHYVGRLRQEGLVRARLGDVIPNPTYRPAEREIPWSERYKWPLWITLLGMLAVLAFLVYRAATGPAAKDDVSNV